MRIRDKLFPEGTKIRSILRKLAILSKGLLPRNWKKIFETIKKDGLKVTIKKIKGKFGSDVKLVDENVKYQEWIKNNEPTKEEIEAQRKVKFKINPKISILVPMYNTPYNFFEELVDCLINQTYTNWELCLADGSPEQNKELEKIYKKDDRIKFAAVRNMLRNTVVVAFSLTMGIVLDKCTASGYELYGFLVLFFVVFVIAYIDIVIKVNTYKPEIEKKPAKVLDTIKMPAKDKQFRKVLMVCGLNRFAYGMGTMYLNVFVLRYLHVNYLYYGILNILINLASAISSNFWKKQAKDRKWKKVILPMCLACVIAFGILFYFENAILMYLLPIVYILIGIYDSAYDMYDHTAIYESAKEDYQTSYVTFERFVEGIVTAILPILSYTIFKESSNAIKTTFGIAIITYIILFIFYSIREKKSI